MVLKDLRPGERAVITGFLGEKGVRRMMEMGLLPGTKVEVIRLAPLGDPMELRVSGYRLSIRGVEAEQITVEHEQVS